ncbi:NAD-glutamate dehydrogenase [Solirubrobacter sp. CPCC 204708]|uniref:NAD-glutamate dehydrogenase n=1 Tax=Solirubrobacter deserti TaxID=2282478 RepID=A0ABT4RDF2_9ACTN|nr:NAD-glutamate dehydrogenase [Solirubrobacter deserti]MBE2317863.1 NAD-glutamate dehydrogenase [Solirubrobacter deserti]MDA0136360.1 NAD-glutamate dehydrogenase [Solirubrobacter deserti]
MSTPAQDVESALIESVCERVRERVAPEEVAEAEAFVRQYYRRAPAADLKGREPVDLYGAALAHWAFGKDRAPGEPRVRAYNPTFEQHGWQSPHTAIEVVSDDMPFLVDSASMELSRRELGIHVLVHPVIGDESYMHIEVDRQADGFETLEQAILGVLAQVRAAVEDWQPMRERMQALLEEPMPAGVDTDEFEEARALLAWVADHHFTYLGYREYELTEDSLRAVEGSGLGLLRGGGAESTGFSKLPVAVRALAREPDPLVLAKATTRSPVHRPAYLDYIGVKRFDDDGNVIGERRFLGLYTTGAYREVPANIPVLRRKAAAVRERAGFVAGSHDDKALVEVIDTFPRDELFQIGVDDLYEIAVGILELGERQRVRLFMRTDRYERFVSCLVFVPRDRFNTANRIKIGEILTEALGAESLDWGLRLTEWVLVRIHYTLHLPAGTRPDYDAQELEARIVEAIRSWDDDLFDALLEEFGEESGMALNRQYGAAFPPAYRHDLLARSAVADVQRIEGLSDENDLDLSLYRPLEAPPGALRCKVYRRGERVSLSDVLPMFESLGLTVTDERPYQVTPREGPPAWLYDFGLHAQGPVDVDAIRDRFHEGFERVWRGEAEQDGFNGLILAAGLDWREVTMLRAVARYLRQAGIPFSDRYMENTLLEHAGVARALVELFRARFDPSGTRGGADRIAERIEQAIDAVDSLDQDRILRGFLSVVTAMLRTNYFLPGPKPYVSFKLDPHQIPLTPLPRPKFEIFVHSPRVEGVHLRGGAVARGGLRWSDRREDFRTEILGLMKAQMVKNAVIVPVGSKGGFVVKRPGDQVVECYTTFLSGLLDVTDNIVGEDVVPPSHVVRADGDDPYLVVAADKGTATFSDIANGVANQYGFWLGDAFASGGSVGYDHKAMGITARSAWVSVQRHFRELGVDVQAQDFTVAGIGDMSGDVFGNGMMLSPHIKLVAAFDHRHVFLDPDPDPAASLAERERLFKLPRSSWDDYDRALISEGGGIFPRTAKSIDLTPQVREALAVEAERLTPSELIQAILRAPVDLLWNGGIGTYVKAASETHADVGDKANDAVRVNGRELRARVVGEGGNLGGTQRGRIEFALEGGRINTDAIDNAGGVNCSDHEVNIKVLLDSVVAAGDMTVKQRNRLLAEMTDAVAERVLRGSYTQTQALSLARFQAPAMLDVHDRFMRDLEASGRLDRAIEMLPDADAIAERRQAGLGLTQPELAVVLAYAKITLYAALLDSDLPDDPALEEELAVYFPPPLPERFRAEMARHRLRREIIATRVANQLVDRAGVTFLFRLREDTGASHADIARASVIARDVFDMRTLWADVEALDGQVTADTQTFMLLSGRRMVERATRWLLRTRPRPLDIGAEVARFADGARAVAELLPGVLVDAEQQAWRERVGGLCDAGVPEALAARVASQGALFAALDIVEVAGATERGVEEVAALHFELGGRLHLHWLRDQIAQLTRDTRWATMARAALRDDLFSLHADLTREVLRFESLDAWFAANRAAVERAQEILGEIRAGGTFDLTTLPVALREVRNLIAPAGRT